MLKPKFLFLAVLFLSACTKTIPVTSVTLSELEITVTEGETYQLSVTVAPSDATDKTVKWESSNVSVATVTQNGNVSGIHEGNAIISASCGGLQKNCLVSVRKAAIPVSSLHIDQTSLKMRPNETSQLVVTIEPPEAAASHVVTWRSNDQSVAIVNDGLVTALAEGIASIIAEVGGKSATCSVTVSNTMSGGNEGTSDDKWD